MTTWGPDGDAAARTVTVVVPTKDDPRLSACLEALASLDPVPGWHLDVVVADNGSSVSPEPLVARHPGMRFVVEQRRGSYAARNAAIAAGVGEVVAFTDSDCRPHPGWLSAALRRLDADPSIDAVAGRVRTVFDEDGPRTAPGWWDVVEAFPQERYVSNGFGVTANLIVRREAGAALGWFDVAALSGGDADFGRRLTGSGRRLVYEAAAVVDHPARTTWSEMLAKARRTSQGRARNQRLAGRSWGSFLREVGWQFVQVAAVVKRALAHPALTGPGARLRYLGAGLVFRAYWLGQMIRWELHFRTAAGRKALT